MMSNPAIHVFRLVALSAPDWTLERRRRRGDLRPYDWAEEGF